MSMMRRLQRLEQMARQFASGEVLSWEMTKEGMIVTVALRAPWDQDVEAQVLVPMCGASRIIIDPPEVGNEALVWLCDGDINEAVILGYERREDDEGLPDALISQVEPDTTYIFPGANRNIHIGTDGDEDGKDGKIYVDAKGDVTISTRGLMVLKAESTVELRPDGASTADGSIVKGENLNTFMKTSFSCQTALGPSGPMIVDLSPDTMSEKGKVY